ncbi:MULTISPECIES: OmpP1/FadL family transporter [Legionella]|uniref:Outer membrane protein transport protein n=1 Tax=Legionella resiliens TaxID=2905958 RepID=A0ABS8X5W7_9GAMM|nr:outer membrane protein transport protein [Legionella sp. PC1000]MCE0723390.1 outer membrane protein transport protein [Legionella sp. 9fVS26]MCE3532543.1 outer membrane protein transport protein [Legionella sp. 8cVS16]
MKNMHKPLRTLVSAAVISVLAAGGVHAAGFSLYGEGAGYAVGNYAAGSAAEAADASTGWYNPAGLALIREQQVVFSGVGIFPTMKLDGTSTFTTRTGPASVQYIQDFNGVDGSYNGFVPSFHYARPLGERTTFALSVTSPFGLSTDWAPDSPVRYSATYTEILTMNVSPELGTRLTEHFALGAGLDIQWSRAKFNQIIGAPTLFQILGDDPALVDTLSYNKAKSYGVGFHVGVMGIFNDNHTRIGINYQSRIRHVFYGHSRLTGILANNDFNLIFPVLPPSTTRINNELFSDPQEFPDVLTLSAYQDINEKLALLGSVVYTGWGVFKQIQLNNVAVPNIGPPLLFNVTQANINSLVPQNYHDSWRVALGANYHVNPKLMLRVGGGYDQTPTNDIDRNIRLPDIDRWAIAVGAHYQWRPTIGVDLGYTHLFAGGKPDVNSVQALSQTSTYNVSVNDGHFAADLVGAQLTWVMDKVPEVPTK